MLLALWSGGSWSLLQKLKPIAEVEAYANEG